MKKNKSCTAPTWTTDISLFAGLVASVFDKYSKNKSKKAGFVFDYFNTNNEGENWKSEFCLFYCRPSIGKCITKWGEMFPSAVGKLLGELHAGYFRHHLQWRHVGHGGVRYSGLFRHEPTDAPVHLELADNYPTLSWRFHIGGRSENCRSAFLYFAYWQPD